MEIIFHGSHNTEEAAESLLSVLRLFKEKYNVANFQELRLHLTLLNAQGEVVELVDTETAEIYRFFDVYKNTRAYLAEKRPKPQTMLHLVVDNLTKRS